MPKLHSIAAFLLLATTVVAQAQSHVQTFPLSDTAGLLQK